MTYPRKTEEPEKKIPSKTDQIDPVQIFPLIEYLASHFGSWSSYCFDMTNRTYFTVLLFIYLFFLEHEALLPN